MKEDLDHIMSVMEAAFDPQYGEAWNRRQVDEALVLPNTHYLLAGSCGGAPSSRGPCTGFTLSRSTLDEEELLLIAVHPDYRHNGVGRKLAERFMNSARERGVSRVFLEMRDGNPAGQLYRSLGFEPVGRRHRYYRSAKDGPLDAVTFACTL